MHEARSERGRLQSSASRLPLPHSHEWWSTYFDERYLREYEPLFDLERDRREVSRLVDVVGLPVDSRVLDCPCGQGRHAHLLAEAGFDVDGADFSQELLAIAKKRGESDRLRYTRADMRRLPTSWTGRFDAVVNLFTSFGFFLEPDDDARVVREFARVLRKGGTLVWHGASRDGVSAKFLARDWWRTADGTMVAQQRSFDPLSGILTVESEQRRDGTSVARTSRIRLYTATRISELCRDNGLVVERAYDDWTQRPLRRTSSEMLLVARKEGEV